jgi:Predicted membrane protein (DUF2157)
MMSSKQEVLQDIIALAKHNNISLDEIKHALEAAPALASGASSSTLSKLFSYIGGIFVFAGIGVFIGMYWDDFGSAARVIVTLGVGFAMFVMALVCLSDKRYEKVATPLFLAAMWLQPTGILVMLQEYSSGGDARHGVLFMAGVMLVQQAAVFWSQRRTVLAFGAVLFGAIFFAQLFDIWDWDENFIGLIIGFSLICVAYALQQSKHAAISAFWYFIGALILMVSLFDLVKNTPLELLFIGFSALLIFVSTHVRSRALLIVGTLCMLSYIGYYTAQHFANTVGWPIALVIIGIALIGLGSLAVRLNNKYIKQ